MDVVEKLKKFAFDKTMRGQYVVKIADRIFHYGDKKYLEKMFRATFGYAINWDAPKTFNEKLNWLKLYNRHPEYTQMVDKFEAKKLVKNIVGGGINIVKNFGVWNTADEIDFDALPEQFVLKGTHCGVMVCKDKSKIDIEEAKRTVSSWLKYDYFWPSREYPYKNVERRIIADEYLDDGTGNELRDYKFWCFNGKPTYMYCTVKNKSIFENFYDMDFNPVNIDHGFPRHVPEFEKPKNFDLMKSLAAKLSAGIPFVRVDFFDVAGKVYFSEFTFFDWGAHRPFKNGWDEKLGELLSLPQKYEE